VCDLNAKLAESVAPKSGVSLWSAMSPTRASAEAAIVTASKAPWSGAGIGELRRDRSGKTGDRPRRPDAARDFDKVIRVNLIGSFNMLRLATAEMSKAGALETGERAS